MNLNEELEMALDEEINNEYGSTFLIDNTDKADWALRKIDQYQKKINDAKELKAKRLKTITDWCNGVETENLKHIEYFEMMLRPYAEQQLKDSKKRSITLPNGTLGFRKASTKFTIDGEPVKGDLKTLIDIAESISPEFVKTEKYVEWADFKKTLKVNDGKVISADGEILEDIKVEIGEDSFYTKGVK